METGTGKTYVYLRTIFELSRRYGFQKFIIVVPSVAIREGVLKNIEITAEHFRALYNNLPFEHFVYDAKTVNRLRQFATSNTLQILVINIDAFRKNFTGTEAEQKSNVIYKESDKLSGRQPIEFVQAARPIVIIDEPQSVDSTEKAQEAIKALNPLCTLRYSATHRNPYNLVYRLDPGAGVRTAAGQADRRGQRRGRWRQPTTPSSASRRSTTRRASRQSSGFTCRAPRARKRSRSRSRTAPTCSRSRMSGPTTRRDSGRRDQRRARQRIHPLHQRPHVCASARKMGGMREDDLAGADQTHGEEAPGQGAAAPRPRHQGVEPLLHRPRRQLPRLRRGRPADARASSREVVRGGADGSSRRDARYAALEWLKQPVEKLHNGYFAQDEKGVLKDTRGDTQADDEVYNLIMKDKERLLSMDEPLRFIFSHSALREGWDNPNVFQICTLNETTSAVKKRQEIGRGLRLPVDQDGMRVFDDSVNKLYVMANESYEDFARALQTEYEEDCGVTFGKVPLTALAKLTRVVDGEEQPIGREAAEVIRAALVEQKMLDADGRIQPAFDPEAAGFHARAAREVARI